MKKLVAIAAAGIVGVVTLAFVVKAGIYMIQGRPIAQVTGIRLILLHDTMMLLAILIGVGLCIGLWILSYYDPENGFAWIFRWKQLK